MFAISRAREVDFLWCLWLRTNFRSDLNKRDEQQKAVKGCLAQEGLGGLNRRRRPDAFSLVAKECNRRL
jgi:hypothetical protein